jgi:hypothetical protein
MTLERVDNDTIFLLADSGAESKRPWLVGSLPSGRARGTLILRIGGSGTAATLLFQS